MNNNSYQPTERGKKRSLLLGLTNIVLAVLVFYMNRFLPPSIVVQARILTVGLMGFLLMHDWRSMYLEWKEKNK